MSAATTWRPDAAPGADSRTLSIDPRFCGLPGLVQGGYSSGTIAGELGAAAAEVKLRRPVPAGRPLQLSRPEPGVVELRDGSTSLAVGRAAALDVEVPEAPSFGEAAAGSEDFLGHRSHPYPQCFACGPDRAHGDGLRVFPGAVPGGSALVAAPWTTPDERGGDPVGPGLIWAAFDCAQLWALIVHARSEPGERVVTAALAAEIRRPVEPGRSHVVIAWPIAREASALRAGAALIGPDGEVDAVGVQTAVLAKWGVPLDLGERSA